MILANKDILWIFRILKAIIEVAGNNINKVEDAADVLEAAIEAYFRDIKMVGGQKDPVYNTENSAENKWSKLVSILKFPSRQEKITLFIDHCLTNGHVLLLYAYITQKRVDGTTCSSIKDEEVLLSSLIDWLRHIKLR